MILIFIKRLVRSVSPYLIDIGRLKSPKITVEDFPTILLCKIMKLEYGFDNFYTKKNNLFHILLNKKKNHNNGLSYTFDYSVLNRHNHVEIFSYET